MTASSGFLYPMLGEQEHDPAAVLADLARSALAKACESAELCAQTLSRLTLELDRTAAAVATAVRSGGRVLCFGNGGSATDAAGLADLLSAAGPTPPVAARSLAAEPAVLTALANDVGVEAVFARQLMAHGRVGDVAVGLSTSGGSANVLRAFVVARERGMLTVGLAGYGGGAMASCPAVEHLLAVEDQSVHRTQEAQSALVHELCLRVRRDLEHEETR